MNLRILFATICGGWLIFAFAKEGRADDSYTFSTIQVPEALYTIPYGINNNGQVFGNYAPTRPAPLLDLQGFVRESDGTTTTIEPPGGTSSTVTGVNAGGQVVGYYDSPGAPRQGFMLSGSTFTTIQYPGASFTLALGINDFNQIVGYYNDQAGNSHGFLYEAGIYSNLDMPGASDTLPWRINNSGEIVGYYETPSVLNGFLYRNGTYTPIVVSVAVYTYALGINNSDEIVGFYSDISTAYHCFIDRNGVIDTSFNVPGFAQCDSLGVNDIGQIVGYGLQNDSLVGFKATPVNAFAGTPGKANCHGKSVSALARQYGGLNGAAAALGYADVSALQNAILMFCGG
jgi:uncharacterized membrane protein